MPQVYMSCAYVEGPCVWQSVYCGWKSWVLVGPTTWYSSVPTMHQLCLVSDKRSVASNPVARLLDSAMSMAI
jgi:hypothetical protein